MNEQIEISEAALDATTREVDEVMGERTNAIGYHVQQLLNAEAEKYIKQVHECGAMLRERNAEIEKLRKENEELKIHLQKSMVIALRQNEH